MCLTNHGGCGPPGPKMPGPIFCPSPALVRDVRRGEEDQIRGRSEERKSIGEEEHRRGAGEEEERRGPGEEEQRRGTGDEQEERNRRGRAGERKSKEKGEIWARGAHLSLSRPGPRQDCQLA